ncbi:hypothetical protein AB0J86_18005 [Micromonospora sp. NPDC049559]|uniref:hypothetical protein n=1 Tax=Micromonospora sp. NPDC049559 TaxID=3155923 RepID=UPI003438D0AE
MTLERAYRWLLACYPREHRRQYEEEMLGVLLDDADPGQRRPRAKDVRALLAGALRARTQQAVVDLSSEHWRSTAAVFGLVAPLALLAYAGRYPLFNLTMAAFWGVPGFSSWQSWAQAQLPWETWVPAVGWLAVAVLAATRWRRAAAVLAWPAAVLEVLRAARDHGYYYTSVVGLWPVALAVLAAAALTVPASRSATALLGRWRIALLAGATLLVGSTLPTVAVMYFPAWQGGTVRTPLFFTNAVSALEAVLLGAGYLLGLGTVLSIRAPLRRRVLALLAPVGALLLLSRIGYVYLPFLHSHPFGPDEPAGLNPGQWLVLVLIPVLTLAVAVAAVHRWERPRPRHAPAGEN